MNQTKNNDIKSMATAILVGIIFFVFAFFMEASTEKAVTDVEINGYTPQISSPPCVQMFYSIEKYSMKYKIPKKFAYGIAYSETRYSGPFHWTYDHEKISSAGAVGPMQVMYTTAKFMFPKKKFSKEKLMNDIDFNVECSMKLLSYLKSQYGDWKLVFGAYNTGRPLINQYALNVYNYQR
jgi:hypothetical protein